ncbi:MAG: branched-chain-amino-acid transaminase [Tepidisphaeraceae bacterium]
MSLQVWIDDKLYAKQDAKISVYDHGLLYGDGVFEGIRAYSGRIFACDAHIKRLFDSAKAIRLQIPYTPEQLVEAMYATMKANNFTDCYIRLVVTRGAGTLGLDPNRCERPSVIIITDTIHMYPPEMYENGMAVITASVIRNHPNALSPRIKSLNYLNNILAKLEAIDAGVREAVMLNHEGYVAECTGDNIFIVRGGKVYTPPAGDGSLEGVTRAVIMDLCAASAIHVLEQRLERHDLYIADECFLTGTAAEVIPVTKIDGRVIGTGQRGPITQKLHTAFHKLVRMVETSK